MVQQRQKDFPEVKAEFQEIFLGSTPISRCRFSAPGNNIVSASVEKFDGKNNFTMWQCEVCDALSQQDIEYAILEVKPAAP
ncbi:hypothetical protein MKX03_019746 [Papaver bracteatum]|nr:hypothetical protein MKX03_019746 [Papaver bracteatum]